MQMPSRKHNAPSDDPMAELRGLSHDELSLRARAHLQALQEEMADLKSHVEKKFHPAVIAKKHPLLAAGMGAVLGYWVIRKLRGRRRSVLKMRPETEPPESPRRAFRNSLLSGLAKAAGTALPAALLWGIRRRMGKKRK